MKAERRPPAVASVVSGPTAGHAALTSANLSVAVTYGAGPTHDRRPVAGPVGGRLGGRSRPHLEVAAMAARVDAWVLPRVPRRAFGAILGFHHAGALTSRPRSGANGSALSCEPQRLRGSLEAPMSDARRYNGTIQSRCGSSAAAPCWAAPSGAT
jgi:hypothetical protein